MPLPGDNTPSFLRVNLTLLYFNGVFLGYVLCSASFELYMNEIINYVFFKKKKKIAGLSTEGRRFDLRATSGTSRTPVPVPRR